MTGDEYSTRCATGARSTEGERVDDVTRIRLPHSARSSPAVRRLHARGKGVLACRPTPATAASPTRSSGPPHSEDLRSARDAIVGWQRLV
ncbi:hypothetical protein HX747_30870 [Streptomyces sp. L06]|nr:hypothetical protein [Streptomyces sp. L06]